jgi:response regulator RpfG family c-di-GMP phosphodiesterase
VIAWVIVLTFAIICLALLTLHLPLLIVNREGQLAKGISTAIEHRGPFLAGMSQEIVELSASIADLLGLNREETRRTITAAKLCDLGLCSVPSELLLKNNEWTPEEEAIYDRHPDTGAHILRTSPALKSYSKIVRFHHSRFEVIPDAPIESRVICAASDYVRFRRLMGAERALLAMERQSGLHYDPEVVEAIKLL